MLAELSVEETDRDLVAGVEHDRAAWASAVLIGLVFACAAMAYSLYIANWIFNYGGAWMQPVDVWMPVDAGRFVWSGALGYVYQGTGSYSLPLSFILTAPISGLVDHYRLIEGAPYPVAHPNAWLLVGPYSLIFGVFLLHAVRRIAWELGMRQRLWLLQVAACVVVLMPAFRWGHFEDVIALTFVLHALRRLRKGHHLHAAFLLSMAIASKQWALPLIPFFVLASPAGRRMRTLLTVCALPGALTLFVLGVDWADASKALLFPVNLGRHTQGHLAFYASWLGSKTSQLSRSLGLLLATAMAWRLRRVQDARLMLSGLAAVLLLRPLFEAISYSYYWSPGLLLAGLAGVAADRRFRCSDWIWPTAVILWATPRGNSATATLWWAGEAILLAAAAFQVMSSSGLIPAGGTDSVFLWVKKSARQPILKVMNARAAGEESWTR
jgi:hypothetical protein